jgi:hypothetical protein
MWSWVVAVACYCVAIGFSRLVGGVNSASKAIQQWGDSNGRRRGPALLDRMRR